MSFGSIKLPDGQKISRFSEDGGRGGESATEDGGHEKERGGHEGEMTEERRTETI